MLKMKQLNKTCVIVQFTYNLTKKLIHQGLVSYYKNSS